jgi:hypothetical protein
MCSGIGGRPLPKESGVTDADDKSKIVADVRTSFEYCVNLLRTLDDSRLRLNSLAPPTAQPKK